MRHWREKGYHSSGVFKTLPNIYDGTIFPKKLRRSRPGVFCKKKLFLKFLQNSQENTCAGVSFFNKLAGLSLQLY